MLTYCFRCKKHTDNIYPKKLIMVTNRGNKGKSRCANCMANKSFSDKNNGKVSQRFLCINSYQIQSYKTKYANLLWKVQKKKPQKIQTQRFLKLRMED